MDLKDGRMANIVLGLAVSHGPLISTPPGKWDLRAEADRKNPALAYRGAFYTFEELRLLRASENLEEEIRLERRQERHDRNQAGLAAMADLFEETAPDVVVMVGDDQHEWFHDDIQPTFAIYHGKSVINRGPTEAELAAMEAGPAIVQHARRPPVDASYPCRDDLALYIIDRLMQDGFDVTACSRPPNGAKGPIGIGHAFGLVYRQVMRDKPVPLVPVMLNTFFPPNQAMPGRCLAFGRAIGRAIMAWPGDARVLGCASGGLSHFVIDQDFDRRILDALRDRDFATIDREPNHMFRSGTSETKNWITAAGILDEAGLRMSLMDYVPCYRSEAGTGNAMGFARWN